MTEEQGAGPWHVKRRYSGAWEVCPEVWLGEKAIATVLGCPCYGYPSLSTARRIVAALNAVKDLTTEELEAGPRVEPRRG